MKGSLFIVGAGTNFVDLTAQEVSTVMQEFFQEFERLSPWKRPFSVTGISARTADMQIAEDFSNFDPLVFKVFAETPYKLFNADDPENIKFTPRAKNKFGMNALFSELISEKKAADQIGIELDFGAENACSFILRIPSYHPEMVNAHWATKEQVYRIFDFFIDFFGAYQCFARDFDRGFGVLDREIDNYLLDSLSYSRNPRVMDALKGDPRVTSHHDGVLVTLGESVFDFERPDVTAAAIEIRDKLRAAGATDWLGELRR